MKTATATVYLHIINKLKKKKDLGTITYIYKTISGLLFQHTFDTICVQDAVLNSAQAMML